MHKISVFRLELLIVISAFALGAYYHLPALTDEYVINDDVRQHIYWMQQFGDSDLFRDDLLTAYAKNLQPWGIIFIYYIFSFIASPLTLSKILPIILFPVSALYMYKLLKIVTGSEYTGLIGALIFIITPAFFNYMAGGNPRSFSFPLLIIFLYYLIGKNYFISSVVMIAQCLFYPIVALLAYPTYLLSFVRVAGKKVSWERSTAKIIWFVLSLVICIFMLSAKYVSSPDPLIGRITTRSQMVDKPEYYRDGRVAYLPVSSVTTLVKSAAAGLFSKAKTVAGKFSRLSFGILSPRSFIIKALALTIIFGPVIFLIVEIARGKISFPLELYYLLLSSIIMYAIADIMLLRLSRPEKYLFYPARILGLIAISAALGQIARKIRNGRIKKIFQTSLIVLILLSFRSSSVAGLKDFSRHKELYQYLGTLPKEAFIAAPPRLLGDNIPIFSRRKVFINEECSVPVYDQYWETIKRRTYDYFDAYFSEKPVPIYEFCEREGINYVVVDKRHFSEQYLRQNKIYFEPFNSYIIKIIGNRRDFALDKIPGEDKLFSQDGVFVISADVLARIGD